MKAALYFIVCIAFTAILLAPADATTYAIHDLGSMVGGFSSHGYSINTSGITVGYRNMPHGEFQVDNAFTLGGGSVSDLGNLPGGHHSRATAINSNGVAVGYASNSNGRQHAFVWNATDGMKDIDTTNGSWARGINDNEQVVGYFEGSSERDQHAFLWDSQNGMRNIGALATYNSYAYSINGAGQIAGSIALDYDNYHHRAVIWDTPDSVHALPTPNNYDSEAFSINNAGQAVGYIKPSLRSPQAVVWTGAATPTILGRFSGDLSSTANTINNNGLIVGWSILSNGQKRAVFWETPNSIQYLESLAGESEALGVNDRGWIVGWSADRYGTAHAVLWTPVPEPSSIFALLSGVVGSATFMWSRKK